MTSNEIITASDILRVIATHPDLVGAIERSGVDFCTIARAVRTGESNGADLAIASVGIELGLDRDSVIASRGIPVVSELEIRRQAIQRRQPAVARLARRARMRNVHGVAERVWRLRNAAGLELEEAASVMETDSAWLRQLEAGHLNETEIPIRRLFRLGRYIETPLDLIVDEQRSELAERTLFTASLERAEDHAASVLVQTVPKANVAEYRLVKIEIGARFERFLATAGPRNGRNRLATSGPKGSPEAVFRLSEADIVQMWSRANRTTRGDHA